jgi:hypothetical protein
MIDRLNDPDFREALPYFAVGAARGVWEHYKPELMVSGLAAATLAYDLKCRPGGTVSEAVDGLIDRHPIITRVAIGMGALHLANLIPQPDRFDLIHIAFKKMKG